MIVTTLPIILGLFYLAAGVGHFANSQAFQDIYPPIGTWGIWYLPGSAEFHVAWTGMVEVLGAVGLLLGAARDILGLEEDGLVNFIKPISAALLFVLTVVVTPANIFMFTHGAVMGDMAPLDTFHVTRFAVQVLLLSLLFTLARDGFFFAWGEEPAISTRCRIYFNVHIVRLFKQNVLIPIVYIYVTSRNHSP